MLQSSASAVPCPSAAKHAHVLVLLVLAAAGCDRASDANSRAAVAAPARAHTTLTSAVSPSAGTTTVRTTVSALSHTIGEGESLWTIARSYGVTAQQLMESNGLSPSAVRRLRSGSVLKIEGARVRVRDLAEQSQPRERAELAALPDLKDGAYHMLSQGESLWSLARLYDVPLERLMARNGFNEDIHGRLRIGQAIIIPGLLASQIKQRSFDSRNRIGLTHSVSAGETVWDIARRYNVGVGEIMAANGLRPEQMQAIRENQKLFLPGVREDRRGRVQREPSARERRAQSVAQSLGLGTLKAAGRLLHGQVEPRWIAAAGSGKTFAGTLRWPVAQGWFVRGFGSGQGGYHKAMDIMGRMGWNVRAAAGGIVGYAGSAVPGFGNMVMVVHPGGWVTLYAHNSVNFVSAGERVDKGSILAEVGSTGRSDGPHVHFELIYEGQNCDPAPLFRPGVRVRSGRFSNVDPISWRNPSQRPRQVQCQKRQKHPQVVLEDPSVDATSVDESTTRALPAEEPL